MNGFKEKVLYCYTTFQLKNLFSQEIDTPTLTTVSNPTKYLVLQMTAFLFQVRAVPAVTKTHLKHLGSPRTYHGNIMEIYVMVQEREKEGHRKKVY